MLDEVDGTTTIYCDKRIADPKTNGTASFSINGPVSSIASSWTVNGGLPS